MSNVAQNETPKTPAPGESKPSPQQQTQTPGDKPADQSNQQK